MQALKDKNREGIARWVMRKKAYAGALRVSGDYLSLITLHHAEEVLSDRDLPAPRTRGVTQKELSMAKELVGALEGELNFEQFRDEHRDRLIEFIKAKAKGRKPKLRAARAHRATASLERGPREESRGAEIPKGEESCLGGNDEPNPNRMRNRSPAYAFSGLAR